GRAGRLQSHGLAPWIVRLAATGEGRSAPLPLVPGAASVKHHGASPWHPQSHGLAPWFVRVAATREAGRRFSFFSALCSREREAPPGEPVASAIPRACPVDRSARGYRRREERNRSSFP